MFHYQKKKDSHENQLIIDCLHDGKDYCSGAQALAKRLNLSHPRNPCLLISVGSLIGESSKWLKKIKKIPTRIYIIGHGDLDNPNFVSNALDQNIHVDEVADALAELIQHAGKVAISLLMCHASATELGKNSFGAQLHFKLAQRTGQDNPVMARDSAVVIFPTTGDKKTIPNQDLNKYLRVREQRINATTEAEYKLFYKQSESYALSKRPGSKCIFRLNEDNQQIRVDAYDDKWKKNVLKFLEEKLANTADNQLKPLLKLWLEVFSNKESKDIDMVIQQELSATNSVLESPLKKELIDLVAQREKIYSPIDTLQTHETGNGSPFAAKAATEKVNPKYDAIMGELDDQIKSQEEKKRSQKI